jgi:CRP-like cAMP-binding protein
MSVRFVRRQSSLDLLVTRLGTRTPLSEAERHLLNTECQRTQRVAQGENISRLCRLMKTPRAITAGWAARTRMLPNGNTQVLSIFLPGDLVDAGTDRRPLDLNEIIALTAVSTVSLAPVYGWIANSPEKYKTLKAALDGLEKAEEARLIDNMVRLGCQPALGRTAALILELYRRTRAVGFVYNDSFVMPLTQELLGSTLGLSVVHVSRLLRWLKVNNIVNISAGTTHIRDMDKLIELAGEPQPESMGTRSDRRVAI